MDVQLARKFDKIDQIAVDAYGGRRVLFFATEHDLLNELSEEVEPYVTDIDVWFEPEEADGFAERLLNRVSGRQKILVLTSNPILISEAFPSQIWVYEDKDLKHVIYPTFGAPSHVIEENVFRRGTDPTSFVRATLKAYAERKDWKLHDLNKVMDRVFPFGVGADAYTLRQLRKSMQRNFPLDQCLPRHIYELRSRNLGFGVFNGQQGFIGIREKFGHKYLDTEYHNSIGDRAGTAFPDEVIGVVPDGIEIREGNVELFEYLTKLAESRA